MSLITLTNSGNSSTFNEIPTIFSGYRDFGTSPFSNGVGQEFRQTLVSGCTRLNLVPFNLQNLSSYQSVYLQGISAITEIYPFSQWPNLSKFIIELSKPKEFNVSLPENFSQYILFRNNDSQFSFNPNWTNPTSVNLLQSQFESNYTLSSLTVDFSQKNVLNLVITTNPNLLDIYATLNTGQTLKNNTSLSITDNLQLTGITFYPNNKNVLSGLNISYNQLSFGTYGGTCNPSAPDQGYGGFSITGNKSLKKFNYNLPPAPNRYIADLSSNGLTSFDDDFLYKVPRKLSLSSNQITGISSSFQSWPVTPVKLFPTAITLSNRCTYRASQFEKPTNLLPSDYIEYSGVVTSVTVTYPLCVFNMSSTNNFPLVGNYTSATNRVLNAGQSFGIIGEGFLEDYSPTYSNYIDDLRMDGGFSFTCDDNTPEFNQLKGAWPYGYFITGCTTQGCSTRYGMSPYLKHDGTFYPTNGVLYFNQGSAIDLSNNKLTNLNDTNGNVIPNLPHGLQYFIGSTNPLTGFSSNLNRHLREFILVGSDKQPKTLTTFDGEVSGATELCFFQISNYGLTGWTKYFHTGLTNGSTTKVRDAWNDYYSASIGSSGSFGRKHKNGSNTFQYNFNIRKFESPNEFVNPYFIDDVRSVYTKTLALNENAINNIDFKYVGYFESINLYGNPLSGITNLSTHEKLTELNLNETRFSNSNQIIGDNETWPPTLKFLGLAKNRPPSDSGVFLTAWTKSFSGLNSQTLTANTYSGLAVSANTIEKRWGKGPLILDFRGQYLLSGTSGFDFIVRDLVTARTNGVYLSGGCLLISSTSAITPQVNYIVRNTISTGPTPYTGFTLNDGTEFEVSPTGDMYAWLNILTGQTIGETTGRGWFTELYTLPNYTLPITSGRRVSFFNFYT